MKYVLVASCIMLVALGLGSRPLCASTTGCWAYRSTIKSDLRNLATVQQGFRDSNQRYASSLVEVAHFWPSAGVQVDVLDASHSGVLIEGRHERWPWGRCVMAAGSMAADSLPQWEPVCTGRVR